MLSESSIPSTATASDLPGPGRLLGNFYSWLGNKLENAINSIAEKRGHGPMAIEDRIRLNDCFDRPTLEPKDEKKLMKDLKRLVAYAR